eukprot:TRINITY_DN918_c0_g1_i5.p3 TRINITY_DN918_c0_g1~~TRINITY_DN918_c0_g1_i5.p3  ORF type:complete len:151 (-),score=18.38 TRINITY_DN918_c0_g1_i5:417-869(-)
MRWELRTLAAHKLSSTSCILSATEVITLAVGAFNVPRSGHCVHCDETGDRQNADGCHRRARRFTAGVDGERANCGGTGFNESKKVRSSQRDSQLHMLQPFGWRECERGIFGLGNVGFVDDMEDLRRKGEIGNAMYLATDMKRHTSDNSRI